MTPCLDKDINSCDMFGKSAIYAAVSDNDPFEIQRLISLGLDPDYPGYNARNTPLHHAINKYHHECVQVLLLVGANPNKSDAYGYYPLHVACLKGCISSVEVLIEYSAEIDVKDRAGNTPLFYASLNEQREICESLISAGAQIEPALTQITTKKSNCERIIGYLNSKMEEQLLDTAMHRQLFEALVKNNKTRI